MRAEETRVLSKGSNQTRDVGIGTVDEATLCEDQADYDGPGSRMVIAHVLRPHLEPQCLTASEVLYGTKQLRQILDQNAVVDAALSRIAQIQSRLPGQDLKARRAALQAAVEGVTRRARIAEATLAKVPKHMTAVAACVAGTLDDLGQPGAALVRAALARDLAGVSGWQAKLDHLLGLMWQPANQPIHAAADEFIGDLLGSVAAVREMTGARLTLGATLTRLLEMVEGRIPADVGRQDALANLSQLFRQGRLPAARVAVIERMRRHIKGAEPLQPGQPERENEVLRTLIAGLLTPEGVIGEHEMAEALTARYARRFDQGGSRGMRRAVTAISEGLNDLIARVHYLAALGISEQAIVIGDEVMNSLDACLSNEMPIEGLVFRSVDLTAAYQSLTRAAAAVAASALPAEARQRLSQRVEHVVDEYTLSGRLLPELDASESSSGRQALRLVDLVSSGMISDKRALILIRQRLFDLIRRPGFETELLKVKGGIGGKSELQRFYGVVDRLRQVSDEQSTVTLGTPAATPSPAVATVTAARALPAGAIGIPAPSAAVTKTAAPPPPEPNIIRPAAPPQARSPASPRPAQPAHGVEDATVAWAAPNDGAATQPPPMGDGRCFNCFALKNGAEACPDCGYEHGKTARSPAHLMPGTVLHDRYRTGKVLGQGGFGATYLGWDDRLQVKVAIKEFFPVHLVARSPGGASVQPYTAEHVQSFTKGIHKFLEEARTLARLRDIREIVGIQDYFEGNGTAYLVMELLQGQTMKKYIADQGGRIDYRRALSILMPIMKALHSVHDLGLVHRDISPDNIFMSTGGGVKLLDFGAARESASEGAGLTVILKPGYAPPEQYFSDGKQGPWTDIYALAASFYCAITGRPPIDSTRRIVEDILPKPSALGIALPSDLERVIMTALSLSRQDRYQSMRAMLSAISKIG